MQMNIETSFKIGDIINFRQINAAGKVEGLLIKKGLIMYLIRYIFDGEIKEGYFYADEIRRRQNN